MNIEVTKKQRLFMDARQDEVLYGGAAGGGKTYVQLLDNLIYAAKYPGIKQLILRRTFPELERSILRTMLDVYPKEMYEYNSSKHTMRFRNGSLTDFGYCDNETDVTKYQSAEYDVIRFDEATHFTQYMYEYLRSRIRGTNQFPKQTKCSTNPGNVGHSYFKERFIDVAPPMETYSVVNPKTGVEQTRLFIPSRVTDNTFLMEADPDYVNRLADLPENERRALLVGSWDLYEGQFVPVFSRSVHVIDWYPELTPEDRIYFTMDYGLDCFAGYFIAVTPHERAYVLGEIYVSNCIISKAAELIRVKQKELGLKKVDMFLAPSDMWNRRQETGKSVADIFRENGINLYKTSRDRVDGWAALKEWLAPFEDEQQITVAKLRIYKSCLNLIRCLPALQYDPHRPNDAATMPHEITHAPDALRGFAVYRSRGKRKLQPLAYNIRRGEQEIDRFNSNEMFNVYGGRYDNDSYDSSDRADIDMYY